MFDVLHDTLNNSVQFNDICAITYILFLKQLNTNKQFTLFLLLLLFYCAQRYYRYIQYKTQVSNRCKEKERNKMS